MSTSLVHYRNVIMDSARWDGFPLRDGDIIISTPPKCGTTWTQMICALLIFQKTDFGMPLDEITPWLDQSSRARDDVFATYAAQSHRRFIKTHTPLDGLPWDPRVTYIFVGRDPRDVACSMIHHWDNLDLDAFLALREEAVGNEDVPELLAQGPPARAGEPIDRFWTWVETDQPLRSLAHLVHHLKTFWDAQRESNVILLHYGDLKTDLEGQMRGLAAHLRIDVSEERWPELVRAATFEEMRGRAKMTAPNATKSIWRDATSFFHKGTSGQWRDLLDDEGLQRYARRVREVASPELSAWLHQGRIVHDQR